MDRLSFFIAGCKAERWRWRTWRIAIFCVTREPPKKHLLENYDIDYRADGTYYYHDGEWVRFTDAVPMKPLFRAREGFDFPADSIPIRTEAFRTTVGRMLFNWMVNYYSLGNKAQWIDKTTAKKYSKTIAGRTVDDDAVVEDDKVVYRAHEVAKVVKSLHAIPSICPYISPTAGQKSLKTHPDAYKVRDKMLAETPNPTPARIVEIQDKMIEMDKEWLGEEMAFYIEDKSVSVKRKKLYMMQGLNSAFSDTEEPTFIPTSLSEGYRPDDTVAVNNEIREGSFDRGHETAIGGEKVTFFQRVSQNNEVYEGDCGTTITEPYIIDNDYDVYVGLNMTSGGKLSEFTSEYAQANMGKLVQLRRPIYCKSAVAHKYCSACTSAVLAKSPRLISAQIVALASTIMYAYMSSMHGNKMYTEDYIFENELV